MAQDVAGNVSFEGTSLAPLTIQVRQSPVYKPWYKKWWVWAIVGVVVAGGGTAVGLALGGSDPQPTSGEITVAW